jgi:hypothetical protein
MSASPTRTGSNHATVRVHDDLLLGPVLGRVVGMLAARASCPIDRLDDALLLTDAIAAHAPSYGATPEAPVVVTVRTDADGLELVVEELAEGGAQALLEAAVLPQVGNVLEKVADDVRAAEDGLHVRLRFEPATA